MLLSLKPRSVDDPTSEAADPGEDLEEISERDQQKAETDFALKLVDTLVGLNEQIISNYELTNTFFTKEEVHCFRFFCKVCALKSFVGDISREWVSFI